MSAEWQPIETAPRDGTWFLAVMEGFVPDVVRWHEGKWQHDEDGDSLLPENWPLTHWMPLPNDIPGNLSEVSR